MSSDVPPPPQPAGPPPGWYPVDGGQRWWDGTQWGQFAPQPGAPFVPSPAAPGEGKTQAVFSHVGFFFFSIFLALIFRQTEGDRNEFVKHHATEALNFQLTCAIVWAVGIFTTLILGLVTAGIALFILIPALLVGAVLAIVWSIQAAIAANRGEWYRYPVSWRMVPGAR